MSAFVSTMGVRAAVIPGSLSPGATPLWRLVLYLALAALVATGTALVHGTDAASFAVAVPAATVFPGFPGLPFLPQVVGVGIALSGIADVAGHAQLTRERRRRAPARGPDGDGEP